MARPSTPVEADAAVLPRGTRWLHHLDMWAAAFAIILSFVPYAAINLGASTNVPLSSFLCWYLVVRRLGDLTISGRTLLLVFTPFVATSLRLLLSSHYLSPAAYITWIFYIIPATGMAAAVLVLRERSLPVLSSCVSVSAALAILQKMYFAGGEIPWLWYYDGINGYAPVTAIVDPRFNPRVMGLFPEPSVMGGSLVMAMLLMILLSGYFGSRYTWREFLALALGCPALLLSASGSVVPTLGILGVCAMLPLIRRRPWILLALPPAAVAGAYASSAVLAERTGRFNWSWVDRLSSIMIGLERWISDPVTFMLGIGRGMTTYYFQHGLMPVAGHAHYETLVDMFSVTGRILVENGLLAGALMLGLLAAPFLGGWSGTLRVVALGALVTWLIVATAAITYDSAFWIFGLPGGVLGLALVREADQAAERDIAIDVEPVKDLQSVDEYAHADPATRVAMLRRRRRRRRIRTALVGLAAAGAVLVPGALWRVVMNPRVVAPRPADAIVVLGPSTPSRTALAQRLMKQGQARALVVSAHPSDTPGVRPEPCDQRRPYPVLCFDPLPATTQGEARAIQRLATQHGWRRITIITFTPQVERARLLVERCYSGDVAVVDSREPFDAWTQYTYQSGAFLKAFVTPGC